MKSYKLSDFRFWKNYTVHMRPYLLFVSGIAGLMGTTLTSNSQWDWTTFAISFIPFFLGYGFGQALTDAFQTDTDKISSPYRPLSQGIITPKQVILTSIVGLTLIAAILVYLSFDNIIFSLMSVFGLATYSIVKRYWPFGPFHNSWIVMLLPIMGYLNMGGEVTDLAANTSLWYAFLISFFSYYNFVVIGYLKDIEADRETNYNTFPVVFGWNATLWIGNINILIYLILAAMIVGNLFSIAGLVIIITSIVAIYGQYKGFISKNHNPEEARIPIENTVRAFLLIHSVIMIHMNPGLVYFCGIFYLLFEAVLFYRPERTQI